MHDDDLVVYILNELGSKYKETTVVVRARDTAISFKELHDKVMDYLKRKEAKKETNPPIGDHQIILSRKVIE